MTTEAKSKTTCRSSWIFFINGLRNSVVPAHCAFSPRVVCFIFAFFRRKNFLFSIVARMFVQLLQSHLLCMQLVFHRFFCSAIGNSMGNISQTRWICWYPYTSCWSSWILLPIIPSNDNGYDCVYYDGLWSWRWCWCWSWGRCEPN